MHKEKVLDFCPLCEKETEVELTIKDTEIEVRGEKIIVKDVEYFKCFLCNELFRVTLDNGRDVIEEAFEEYVRRHPKVPKWWEIEDREERLRVCRNLGFGKPK